MTAAITALAHRGLCRRDAAAALGWPYVTFCKRVRRLGLHPLFKAAEWQARSRAGIAREKARARRQRGRNLSSEQDRMGGRLLGIGEEVVVVVKYEPVTTDGSGSTCTTGTIRCRHCGQKTSPYTMPIEFAKTDPPPVDIFMPSKPRRKGQRRARGYQWS